MTENAHAPRKTAHARPKRWDVPFAKELRQAEMDDGLAAELLAGPLKALGEDIDRFPANLPLISVLANDCRVRKFEEGEVVVRKGDYGNSAFFILEGNVNVVLKGLPDSALGRYVKPKAPLLRLIARAFGARKGYPEIRSKRRQIDQKSHESVKISLQDFPEVLLESDTTQLNPKNAVNLSASDKQHGQIFGEIAASGRMPRTATVLGGKSGVTLLELRWQGIREIRKYSPGWNQMLDRRYRERSLRLHLEESDHTKFVSREKDLVRENDPNGEPISRFDFVMDNSQFRSYGEFAWQGSYKEMASADSAERLKSEDRKSVV